jgi:hypothetical protein
MQPNLGQQMGAGKIVFLFSLGNLVAPLLPIKTTTSEKR